MITQEDMDRFLEMEEDNGEKKLLVIDSFSFHEIVVPINTDPEAYLNSAECRQICADQILNEEIDLKLEKVLTERDPKGGWS